MTGGETMEFSISTDAPESVACDALAVAQAAGRS